MAEQSRAVGRRGVLGAGAAAAVLGPDPKRGPELGVPRRLSLVHSAMPEPGAPPLRPGDFGTVGVFDVDWLLEPRFTSLLDNFAASPGAFRTVRFFGALNSGERENTLPRSGGGVWRRRGEPPDFSVTLDAVGALVSRGLIPFVNLGFFPPAVSSSPIAPPPDLDAWSELVSAFLGAVAARFGADEVARWWFEVWNEPNFAPFWAGSFDGYLDLYRATSEAVARSSLAVRLGGPALVYVPGSDGPALMERFLRVLAAEPGLRCDFVSYHRKGIWTLDRDEPVRLAGLVEAAEEIAQAVLRLAPARAPGLVIVNDEADMKVGFDTPYEPRLTERFPAWLAASLIVHEELSARYASHGMRFANAADDANQQLVQAPFDGRRSVMTPTSAEGPGDLLKLPVYAFYELLPLLGSRRCATPAPAANASTIEADDFFHLATAADDHLAVLLTCCPDRADGGRSGWEIAYELRDIPWPCVNAAWFRVDRDHAAAFIAAGGRMPAVLDGPETVRQVRMAQELGVAGPLRSGLALPGGVFRDRLSLAPFATALLWITPFSPSPPTPPTWIAAEARDGNAMLRWTPFHEPGFYTYEVFRLGPDGQPGPCLSPLPLRSAFWVDTAPRSGLHRYGVRTVTASGVPSAIVPGTPVRI